VQNLLSHGKKSAILRAIRLLVALIALILIAARQAAE
jgi:hypothetical protein